MEYFQRFVKVSEENILKYQVIEIVEQISFLGK